jgi:hypothetical protein
MVERPADTCGGAEMITEKQVEVLSWAIDITPNQGARIFQGGDFKKLLWMNYWFQGLALPAKCKVNQKLLAQWLYRILNDHIDFKATFLSNDDREIKVKDKVYIMLPAELDNLSRMVAACIAYIDEPEISAKNRRIMDEIDEEWAGRE